MPLLEPVFREINYGRINAIEKEWGSETAAAAMNHKLGEGSNFTADQVSGYLAIQAVASKKMVVSKKSFDAVMGADTDDGVSPA